MRRRTPVLALAAGVLAGACSDQTEPFAPGSQPEPSRQSSLQTSPDDPISLGRTVTGFGGFYLDSRGKPVVFLKDASQRPNAERALAPFLAQGFATSELRVLPAQYDWVQLEQWFGRASIDLLALPGTVFVDADESTNRVLVGVERGAAARIRGALARLGIPAGAVIVQETEPIRFAATLRNRVRPVVGGLQIQFSNFVCSLGFNAIRSGQNSFITASHCTDVQGGTEETHYWQATRAGIAASIGTEVSDPSYFKNSNGCPAGRRCRFSDASRAAYTAGTTFTLGKIARTTGPNNGSVTISGSLNITAEGRASVGQIVGKVGRTSGWSQGRVTNRCVNVRVTGSDITQLCQNIFSARVEGGDSGSPVFKGSSAVTLVGILWGGSPGTIVYSPISNIERELGSLRTF